MHRLLTLTSVTCLLGLMLLVTGCSGETTFRHIGESCTNLDSCCFSEGLLCQPGPSGAVCAKGCRCHGTSVCTPSSFNEGCPQGSACVVSDTLGNGQCVVLCNQSPCAAGTYQCRSTSDGGPVACEQVDAGDDMGARDLGATTD